MAEIFQDTIRKKQIHLLEIRLRKRDGGYALFDSVLTPIVDDEGTTVEVRLPVIKKVG